MGAVLCVALSLSTVQMELQVAAAQGDESCSGRAVSVAPAVEDRKQLLAIPPSISTVLFIAQTRHSFQVVV